MAYMDLSNAFTAGAEPLVRNVPVVRAKAASLSPLEWLVVAIAERDHLSSLRAPGRLATVLGALFGSRRPANLASPRLEALRRMAVMLWQRGDAVAREEIIAFMSAGYSRAQLELVTESIETARERRQQG